MFEKRIVVDARGHLLGRLASTVAKELLAGQRVVIVRAEQAVVSGSLFRNKLKYKDFLRKRTNTNPRRGPFHLRAPSKILWRSIRGMLPHKQPKGAAALERLRVFEGVPPPYDRVKRVVVPQALAVLRLRPGRKTTVLGTLSSQVGWRQAEVVKQLEDKRKAHAVAFYQRKKALFALKRKATDAANKSAPQDAVKLLQNLGYA